MSECELRAGQLILALEVLRLPAVADARSDEEHLLWSLKHRAKTLLEQALNHPGCPVIPQRPKLTDTCHLEITPLDHEALLATIERMKGGKDEDRPDGGGSQAPAG